MDPTIFNPMNTKQPEPSPVQINLLLVDCKVSEYKIFTESVNEQTYPLLYHPTNVNEIKLPKNKFKRIGIVAHGSKDPAQFDRIQTINWLKELFDSTISDPQIDFLGCGLLLEPAWNDYWVKLKESIPGLIVGASEDSTGNIKSNGNWTMESTGESVSSIYWTTQIENYLSLLTPLEVRTINYIQYQLIDGTNGDPSYYKVCGYVFSPTDVQIVNSIENTEVKTIGNTAFLGCASLTSVTLPAGLETINSHAFNACTSLTSITLPAGLETIRYGAFLNCINLTMIKLPDSLQDIESMAFFGCASLTSIEIPAQIEIIPDKTFKMCVNLTSVKLSNRLTNIVSNAFDSCYKLTSIIIKNCSVFILPDEMILGSNNQLVIYQNEPIAINAQYYTYPIKQSSTLSLDIQYIPQILYQLYRIGTNQYIQYRERKLIQMVKKYIEPSGPYLNPVKIVIAPLKFKTIRWLPNSTNTQYQMITQITADSNPFTNGNAINFDNNLTSTVSLENNSTFKFYSEDYSNIIIGRNGIVYFPSNIEQNISVPIDKFTTVLGNGPHILVAGYIYPINLQSIQYKFIDNCMIVQWNFEQMQFQLILWLSGSSDPGKIEFIYCTDVWGPYVLGLIDGVKSSFSDSKKPEYSVIE
jgi:hypothetical protein